MIIGAEKPRWLIQFGCGLPDRGLPITPNPAMPDDCISVVVILFVQRYEMCSVVKAMRTCTIRILEAIADFGVFPVAIFPQCVEAVNPHSLTRVPVYYTVVMCKRYSGL